MAAGAMSSPRFAIPFSLHLKRSFLLLMALLAIHGGALLLTLSLAWPLWLRLAVAGALLLSLRRSLRLHGFGRAEAVAEVATADGERWTLTTTGGRRFEARLLSATSMPPWLAVVRFESCDDGRRWPLVILPDSADATALRRLHAKLRRVMPALT